MKQEIFCGQIFPYLTHGRFRSLENGRDGYRIVRDLVDCLDLRAYFPEINRTLVKFGCRRLIERIGKLEGFGNSVCWRLMPGEDALKRHLESEWPEGWYAAVEEDSPRRGSTYAISVDISIYSFYTMHSNKDLPMSYDESGKTVAEKKNMLVVIGYMGVKRAYLNVSEEDALKRHLESEWPEGWDAAVEEDTRSLMTSFEFSDFFSVYDAGPA